MSGYHYKSLDDLPNWWRKMSSHETGRRLWVADRMLDLGRLKPVDYAWFIETGDDRILTS